MHITPQTRTEAIEAGRRARSQAFHDGLHALGLALRSLFQDHGRAVPARH